MNSARTINFPILTAFLLITSLCSYSQEDSSENEKSKLILKTANGKVLVVSNKIPTDPAENAKLAKEILEKGKENLKRISYKASFVSGEMTEDAIAVYNKSNPDGTNYLRYEFNGKGSSFDFLQIKNNNGEFNIIGNSALKADFQLSANEISEQGEQATYSLSRGSYRGIPCYIVTKNIQADEGRYDNFIKAMPKYLISKDTPAQLRESFKSAFPTIAVYYIGENDGFIYEYTYYNIRGRKITSIRFGDVKLNVSLDDKLFMIPDNFTVRVANNSDEYNEIEIELLRKNVNEKRAKKGQDKR